MRRTLQFDVSEFIRESNLIDPQFDSNGMPIPGLKPGDPLYDNQLRTIEVIPEIACINPTPLSLVLLLHRELTRGLDVFEQNNNSGQYRRCHVYVGGEQAPSPILAQKLIEEILVPKIEQNRRKEFDELEAVKFAWWCHDLFECIHPFIDGNGRTGRLLLNTILQILGHTWIIVKYKDRYKYYAKIQEFRATQFPELLSTKIHSIHGGCIWKA